MKEATASAWMPIYLGDYLGKTGRLTTEQHGAYLLLIFDYWRNGPPPADDAVLAQITRLSRPAWKKMRATILAYFEERDGKLYQDRVEEELSKASENQKRRTDKAKKAAEARWGHSSDDAPSMPQALHGECPPPSPSPKGSTKEVTDNLESSAGGGKPPSSYAFFGRTIRLKPTDLDRWKRTYHAISDIEAELTTIDAWWEGQDAAKRKTWFHATAGMLNRKHQELLAAEKQAEAAPVWDGYA